MAVVIDKPFFEALGPMGDSVPHVSNCDIVWVVVDYEELPAAPQAKLHIHKLVRTTLERSVEGLTAGYPVSLSEFEGKIAEKLTATPVKGPA